MRLRLVAILLALALTALVVTGAAALALLRGQLVDRVDSQVQAVARSVQQTGRLGGDGGRRQRDDDLPTTQYGVLLLDSGQQLLLGRRLDAQVPAPDLADLTPAAASASEGRPFTVPEIGRAHV